MDTPVDLRERAGIVCMCPREAEWAAWAAQTGIGVLFDWV